MNSKRSTYFAFFFLLCFLASFGFSNYRNINTPPTTKSEIKDIKQVSFSAKQQSVPNNNELLFEENEEESENDFLVQTFILPFFISFFKYETLHSATFSSNPIAEKLSNPIYIKVCNFRI